MISLRDLEAAQKIGIALTSLVRLVRIGLLVDRHQAHEPHQTAYTLLVELMAFVFQVPCHLPHPVKRRVRKLLINEPHQLQIIGTFTFTLIIERRPGQR